MKTCPFREPSREILNQGAGKIDNPRHQPGCLKDACALYDEDYSRCCFITLAVSTDLIAERIMEVGR